MSFKDLSKIEETIPKKDLSNKPVPEKTSATAVNQFQTDPAASPNSNKPETE